MDDVSGNDASARGWRIGDHFFDLQAAILLRKNHADAAELA